MQGDFAACGRRVTLPAAAKSPKRRRGRLRMDTPCPYSPYPGPQMRGLPLEVGRTFPARKTRSAWVRLNPGPLGPWVYKVRFYCGFQTAPGFPSQRSRSVFRRRGGYQPPASLPLGEGRFPLSGGNGRRPKGVGRHGPQAVTDEGNGPGYKGGPFQP